MPFSFKLFVFLFALASPFVSAFAVLRKPLERRLVAQQPEDSPSNVPFYVREDAEGNLIAVVYYGDTSTSPDTELHVPCTSSTSAASHHDNKKSSGPGVVHCIQDGENSYHLVVPFRFERDENGDIVRVVHEGVTQIIPFTVERSEDESNEVTAVLLDADDQDTDADILTIPFYTNNDADGSVTEVVYDDEDEEADQHDDGTSNGLVVLVVVLFALFLVSITCVGGVSCHRRRKEASREATKPQEDEDSKTECEVEDEKIIFEI